MEKVSVACIFFSYVVAVVFAFLRLRGRSAINRWTTLLMTMAGFVANTIYLIVRSRNADLPPLLASTHDWILVVAWVAILLYLFLTILDSELPLGVFVLPLVLLLVAVSPFVGLEPNSPGQLDPRRGWLMLHAALLVFGIVGVTVSLILAVMYLVQHRRLKRRQGMQTGVHLPSLPRLARWNRLAVVVSVPTLTLGMLAGVLLGQNQVLLDVVSDPIVIGSGIGWLVMVGFFLWLLSTDRPAEKQVAMLTVWACGFLLLTIVGLQVVSGGHQMGPAHAAAKRSA
jgi:ABC-type transport system involved in cytochrome c biogenesis permease subunit